MIRKMESKWWNPMQAYGFRCVSEAGRAHRAGGGRRRAPLRGTHRAQRWTAPWRWRRPCAPCASRPARPPRCRSRCASARAARRPGRGATSFAQACSGFWERPQHARARPGAASPRRPLRGGRPCHLSLVLPAIALFAPRPTPGTASPAPSGHRSLARSLAPSAVPICARADARTPPSHPTRPNT